MSSLAEDYHLESIEDIFGLLKSIQIDLEAKKDWILARKIEAVAEAFYKEFTE
jgi:hypothetical protein